MEWISKKIIQHYCIMKTIRYNTFETNSSSTHSMLILTEEEEQKLNSGEFYLTSRWDNNIILKEKRNEIIIEAMTLDSFIINSDLSIDENIENYLEDCDDRSDLPMSLDEYLDRCDLETDSTNYVSPSGDKLKIICQYGYNY